MQGNCAKQNNFCVPCKDTQPFYEVVGEVLAIMMSYFVQFFLFFGFLAVRWTFWPRWSDFPFLGF